MVVHLQRVKKKFATLVDEVQPAMMSQFVIWLDEKVAEFKVQGTMHLDTDFDAPKWIREYSISMMLSVTAGYNQKDRAFSRENTPSPVNVIPSEQSTCTHDSSQRGDGNGTVKSQSNLKMSSRKSDRPQKRCTTAGVTSDSVMDKASGGYTDSAQNMVDIESLNFSSFAQNSALSGFISEVDQDDNNDLNRKSHYQNVTNSDQIEGDKIRELENDNPNICAVKSEVVDFDSNFMKSEPDNSDYECSVRPMRTIDNQAQRTQENPADALAVVPLNSDNNSLSSSWTMNEHSLKRKSKFPNPLAHRQQLHEPLTSAALSLLADNTLPVTDPLSIRPNSKSSVFPTTSGFTHGSWISSPQDPDALRADASQQSLETVYPNNALFTNLQDSNTGHASTISSQIDPTSMSFLHKQLMSESAVELGDSSFYSDHNQSDLRSFDSRLHVSMDDYRSSLITFVKDMPLIWDPTHPDYKNKDQRMKAWEEIEKNLPPSKKGVSAKETWNQLSRCFCNALNRKKKKSGSGASAAEKPWKFEEMMSFLIAVKKMRLDTL